MGLPFSTILGEILSQKNRILKSLLGQEGVGVPSAQRAITLEDPSPSTHRVVEKGLGGEMPPHGLLAGGRNAGEDGSSLTATSH